MATRRQSYPNKIWIVILLFSLILGNKSDLAGRRQVEESMAAQFAAERGLAYIETSAMESANIREAFLTLVRPRMRLNRASSTASSNVSNS